MNIPLAIGPRFRVGGRGWELHRFAGFMTLGKVFAIAIGTVLALSVIVLGYLYVADWLKERYGVVGLSRGAGLIVVGVLLVALGVGLSRIL